MEQLLWDTETTRKKIGKSKYGMQHLIRIRGIEGMVRIGRKIYFDPVDIKKWIEKNKINVYKGGEK